jgi:hypothetical protein
MINIPSMKKILLITFFFATTVCQAQDTLFRIISIRGTVLLDDNTAHCGQHVTRGTSALKIKNIGDYAIILTERGFVFQLNAGQYWVKDLYLKDYFIFTNSTGAIHRDDFSPIRIVNTYYSDYGLFEDSLTVIARAAKNKINAYRLIVVSAFNEKLYDSTSASHVQTVKMSNLYGQEHLTVFHMEGENKRITSREFGVKELRPEERIKIAYDFNCIREDNFILQELSILAICEANSLFYDQVNHLHKLWKYSHQTGSKITHPYYERLVKLYELDQFLPVPLTGY